MLEKTYQLCKGETLTITAEQDVRLDVDDGGEIITIKARDAVQARRDEAAKLTREADEMEGKSD